MKGALLLVLGHSLVMLGNENVAHAHHLSRLLALIANNFLRAFCVSTHTNFTCLGLAGLAFGHLFDKGRYTPLPCTYIFCWKLQCK
jgi:hypothetical protein